MNAGVPEVITCPHCGNKSLTIIYSGLIPAENHQRYNNYIAECANCGLRLFFKTTQNKKSNINAQIQKKYREQMKLTSAVSEYVPSAGGGGSARQEHIESRQQYAYELILEFHSEIILKEVTSNDNNVEDNVEDAKRQFKYKTEDIGPNIDVLLGPSGPGASSVVSNRFNNLISTNGEERKVIIAKIREENQEFGHIFRTYNPVLIPAQTYDGKQSDDDPDDINGIYLKIYGGEILHNILRMYFDVSVVKTEITESYKNLISDDDKFDFFFSFYFDSSLTNEYMQHFILWMIEHWKGVADILPNKDEYENIDKEADFFSQILEQVSQDFNILGAYNPITTFVIKSFLDMIDKLASSFCFQLYDDGIVRENVEMSQSLAKKKLLTLHTCMGYEFSNGECPEPESFEIINENTFSDDNRIFSGINTAIASSANTQTLGGGKRTKRRRRSKRRKTLRKKF